MGLWTKEQRALAKHKQQALYRCDLSGKEIKDSKFHTGVYHHEGPIKEELARALFFFSLDVAILDVKPEVAFKKFFGKKVK